MANELLASTLAEAADPVLTLSQWATGLEVSEKTVLTWIKTGRLCAYRLASGRYIVPRASLRGLVPLETEELAQQKILERERRALENRPAKV